MTSTDSGTGTAAQLSDDQLTRALQAASDRVSVYAGTIYDPAALPSVVADLTLDLAAWWATTNYLKQKDLGANHPVQRRYDEAKAVLVSVRKGEINLDVATTAAASARVINRIPAIFTDDDSDTYFDVTTGTLATDTRPGTGPVPGLLTGWLEQEA